VPLTAKGWTLLFHPMMVGQVRSLAAAYARAKAADPDGYHSNANVRVLAAVAKLVLKTVPNDPGKPDYRIGSTMGKAYRHWSRAKFGQRFRLFFRYDRAAKIIVLAWVNDESTLPARGSKTDPYAIFKAMLGRGNPPDDWTALHRAAQELPPDLLDALHDSEV
jgi:toxin YhaV